MYTQDTAPTWQSWFAWRPVYIGNVLSRDGRAGKLGTVWLEWVERRRAGAYEGGSVTSYWLYRRPGERLAGVAGERWSD